MDVSHYPEKCYKFLSIIRQIYFIYFFFLILKDCFAYNYIFTTGN